MLNRIIAIAGLSAIMLLPQTAAAQSSDFYNLNRDAQTLTAGARLTIPFGQQNKKHVIEGAKFGFAVGVEREFTSKATDFRNIRRAELLNFGFALDKQQPSFHMGETDVTAAFFGGRYADHRLNADEPVEDVADKDFALIVGAILVAGVVGVWITNEIVDDFEDEFPGT